MSRLLSLVRPSTVVYYLVSKHPSEEGTDVALAGTVEARTSEIFGRRKMPPVGVQLSEQQKLACAFRILARHGWTQNLAGHITLVVDDSGSMWANPWGKWWQEVTTSDLVRVSSDGEVLEGQWDVTPAIFIHTEIHRQRADARVAIHNHPVHATLHAGLGIPPVLTEQTGAMFADDVALFNEFTGGIDNPASGQQMADAVGGANAALLVNHGALVLGSTIEEAVYRAVSFERVCELSYKTLLTGRDPVPMDPTVVAEMKAGFLDPPTIEFFWNGAVRQLLAVEPEVLD
jgi:ribulose-5-phosphate 4-epimerase/fuculose-1-phosphate aldolase